MLDTLIQVAVKRDASENLRPVLATPTPLPDKEAMSTTNSRRLERAGTDRCDDGGAERVDDVRYLDVGDRVRLNDRAKPLTVTGTATRTRETVVAGREVVQHGVELEGDWAGAQTYVVFNRVDGWRGIELEEQRCLDGLTGDVQLDLVAMADCEWRGE